MNSEVFWSKKKKKKKGWAWKDSKKILTDLSLDLVKSGWTVQVWMPSCLSGQLTAFFYSYN